MPFASMTTTGARSGEARTAAVIYFNDGDDVILIASNYGGTRHPAWYHNLRANPTARLQRGGRAATYTAAEVTDEGEREHLFVLGDRVYPGYAQYRVRTAAMGRRIPIMRLQRTQASRELATGRAGVHGDVLSGDADQGSDDLVRQVRTVGAALGYRLYAHDDGVTADLLK